ncbi:aldolase/citrate lyase family protein, partial [Streptomyces sp. SM12]|uniref:DUF6986 family protein n=1 Tax=Streptomyces sp. SM12 TaxID=1071602 RepID=UPI000CD4E43B
MSQRERVTTSLDATVPARIAASLAAVDAELETRYPGDPAGRQPVHTVYVPADSFGPGTTAGWAAVALSTLDRHAPDAESFARLFALEPETGALLRERVLAKLRTEPVEDLRVDFEDGYGLRPDDEEDADAARAARVVAELVARGTAPPFVGIRVKCLERAVRDRAIRTLDIFLSGLLAGGALPGGLILTLPKVSYPEQVTAMVRLCEAFESARGLPPGRLGFELQIETSQAVLGADGRATVARLIDAGGGRVTGLHYGTFDYSAALGISAAQQAPDHPVADHAKAVMQVAAAGRGVRISDGSTNIVPTGDTENVHAAWRDHYRLVRRALARGYYQGWDMHPAHLPSRHAAVFAFYLEGLPRAAERLATYLGGPPSAAGAGTASGVLDEPATARFVCTTDADHNQIG